MNTSVEVADGLRFFFYNFVSNRRIQTFIYCAIGFKYFNSLRIELASDQI